jgi:hypothetical protein
MALSSMNVVIMSLSSPDGAASRSVEVTFPPGSYAFGQAALAKYVANDENAGVTFGFTQVRLRRADGQDDVYDFNDPLPAVWGPRMTSVTVRLSTLLSSGNASMLVFRWE